MQTDFLVKVFQASANSCQETAHAFLFGYINGKYINIFL